MMALRTAVWSVLTSSLAFVAACGGGGGGGADRAPNHAASGGPEVCPPLVGSYVVSSDLLESGCPGLERHTEKLVLMSTGPEAGCHMLDQRASPVAGGCSYEETQLCPRQGINVTASISVSVPPDARDIQGTSVIQFERGGQRCMARYRVRYLKTTAR